MPALSIIPFRRATGHILIDEIRDDAPAERVAEINDMMLKPHSLGIVLGFHNGLDRAATFLLGEARFLDAIIRAEGDAHDVISLLHQKHGRDGGVYTAGHAEQNLGFCI